MNTLFNKILANSDVMLKILREDNVTRLSFSDLSEQLNLQ